MLRTAANRFVCAYRDDGPDLCGIREAATWHAAEAWIEQAERAGLAIERHAAADCGADGRPQTVLPGAERAASAELARRRAAEPLRPRAAQAPCDVGLFSDEAAQLDLCEMFQDHEEDGL